MFAELLDSEVLSSELLSGGSPVRQTDVFISASASLDVNGSAFFSSSTAPIAGSSAQISSGLRYQSSLQVSVEVQTRLYSSWTAGASFSSLGSSDTFLSSGGESVFGLASSSTAYFASAAVNKSSVHIVFDLNSLTQLDTTVLRQSLLSASAGSSPSIVAGSANSGFVESFGSGVIAFAGGSNSNVAILSSANTVLSVVSGAFKHSPFSVSSPSSAEFAAGGYFLSATTANAFSYANLPALTVKSGLLHAGAQASTSYSGIGVLRYAPTPDVLRPQEVRYMYRPQEVRVAQAAK